MIVRDADPRLQFTHPELRAARGMQHSLHDMSSTRYKHNIIGDLQRTVKAACNGSCGRNDRVETRVSLKHELHQTPRFDMALYIRHHELFS